MKARLPMLLLAAVAALALVAHKGAASSSQLASSAITAQKPASTPRHLVVLDDPTTPDQFGIAGSGIGRVIKRPFPVGTRPPAPVFTDIGEVADLASSHFTQKAGDTGSEAASSVATKEIPLASTLFQVVDVLLGGGNAAGVSPQQLAYINAQVAKGVSPGRALALAEGRLGTKQILINGEYVTVGGAGLGGPGFSNLEDV